MPETAGLWGKSWKAGVFQGTEEEKSNENEEMLYNLVEKYSEKGQKEVQISSLSPVGERRVKERIHSL